MMNNNWIAPSILSADFARLGEEVDDVINAGADIIHVDVMDNHFVPNLTIGPLVCNALNKRNLSVPLDVHLMTQPVDSLIPAFAEAGAQYITFHPEASIHIDRTIELIRSHNCKPGLAFNPATPLDYLIYTLDKLDLVLIMSVNPGFGGQSFMHAMLPKINQARHLIEKSGKTIRLEVDGGITANNISAIRKAGADTFVAGSAIFSTESYSQTIENMREQLIKA